MNNEHMDSGIFLQPDFPYEDLCAVGEILRQSDIFVPGYIPPPIGLYRPEGFLYESCALGIKTVLLPDRNIVSRIAQVAKGEPVLGQKQIAAGTLAFAQCLDILIEPSLAFHELIPAQGGNAAHEELAWFRIADNGDPFDWLAAGLGRLPQFSNVLSPNVSERPNLEIPLRRWRRNYIAALKIAELELSTARHLDRALQLFEWMFDDFLVAGPAALFACIYFAPNSPPREGLLKQLRSPRRERAIVGIKNASWDITHLSDFIRRIQEVPDGNTRFILASLDEGLRNIARLLFNTSANQNHSEFLAISLAQWWPYKDALLIAETLADYSSRARDPDWFAQQRRLPSDHIDTLITKGEEVILSWEAPK